MSTRGNNSKISTDFNLLIFDLEGNYLPASSLVTNNLAHQRPFEYAKTPTLARRTSVADGAVQYVIARSAIPTITPVADHFRILVRGNGGSGIGPAEYFTSTRPTPRATRWRTAATARRRTACSARACRSISPRPDRPRSTSTSRGNRLATPEVRLQPGVAAADAANTSFFASDSAGDLDTKPNFGGTSAAAPHAATIAALVLQAHGGPRSLTPAQMTSILHTHGVPARPRPEPGDRHGACVQRWQGDDHGRSATSASTRAPVRSTRTRSR